MYNKTSEIKIKAVEEYLKNGKSLRKVANLFNVNYKSVYKWVNLYKENGKEKLLLNYRKPWNKVSKEIEEKVVLLKEKYPSISIRKAKAILEKEGIRISVKGIWGIWKRYGFCGWKKDNVTNDFTECCEWSKEALIKYRIAKKYFEENNLEKCAKILNEISLLPKNDLLLKIPDNYLNIYRRVEKIACLFGEENIDQYIKRIKKIKKILKRKNLNYSLLRINNFYLISLEWKGEFKKIINEVREMKKFIGPNKSLFIFKWTSMISEGIAHAHLLNINEAKKIAKYCEKILKRRKTGLSSYFEFDLGTLFSNLENYKKAEKYYLNSIENVDMDFKRKIKGELYRINLLKGINLNLRKYEKEIEMGEWKERAFLLSYLSLLNLIKGKIEEAIKYYRESINILKKEGLKTHIFSLYLTMASIYSIIGERRKGINHLKSIIRFLEKKQLKKQALILKLLTSKNKNDLKNIALLPTIKLLILVKNRKIKEAYSYAKKNYLMSYFYRYILILNSKIYKKIILPKSFLNLLVFNKDKIIYQLNFLKNFNIYRIKKENKEKIRTKFKPKEKAFLIHLALKLNEPGKKIEIQEIIENFWKNSKKPNKNLTKMLYKIKKELQIPSYLIERKRKKEEKYIENKGIYFITDYLEFENTIAQANAFLNSGEWELAKREFLKFLKFIKKDPFKGIYDRWSENLRNIIINKYREETKKFLKEFFKRKEFKIGYKILKSLEKFEIPP